MVEKPYTTELACPCGSGLSYGKCCAPYHQQQLPAPTPEALMRSRYAAFVLHRFSYLEETHHPDYRHGLTAAELARGPHPHWWSLQVLQSTQQQHSGTVLFKAWFQTENGLDAIYELSNFQWVGNQWFYTDGEQFQVQLPKRNELCICNSGRKFKHCCMNKI
ncbi:YchJ family protein [Shewanella dokdonensis]|uniref:YchJ family protein n=1 Tax=Shewanella dokdonensis TaxID=712036 RepID=UPI002010B0A0|nr:YchJ family protein [Shewanella dokdonensis]MCL1073168.1 YchJ family protein [Shewanella dokdonensis]